MKIQVKREDMNIDRDWENPTFADKVKKKKGTSWLWSGPITIQDQGIMTIAVRKD
jgi:hypothetical protein